MKTKTIYTPLFLLFNTIIISNISAQVSTYQKTYGGANFDIGNCLVAMPDNGFVIAGQSKSYGDTSGSTYILKVDMNGDTDWTKLYGGGWLDGGNSIVATGDGYFLTDHTTSFGAGECDSYVFKVDLNGVKQWNHTFGFTLNDAGYQGIQTNNGQYIITGESQPPSAPSGTPFVAKYDVDGTPLWSRFYGPGEGYRIIQTPDKNFVIAGISTGEPNGPSNNIIVFKIDADGNQLWYKTIPGNGNSQPYGLINTTDSNLLIAGYSTGATDNWQALLIKLTPTGDILWQQRYGNTGNDRAYSVVECSDGFVFAGQTQSVTNGDLDVLASKTDKTGKPMWSKSFGGLQDDWARWITQSADGGFGIVGITQSYGAGNGDVYLIKIDDEGNAPTGINVVNESAVKFGLFPNPAHTSFTIKASNLTGNANFNLFDVTGNLIKENIALSGSGTTISTNNFSSGIYFYSINDTSGKVLDRGKLVID